MSGIIICAKRTQLLPGPADNLLKMTMPNLPRTFAILLLPTLLAGCKLDDIPGLGPDPRTVAKEAEAKAIGGACRHALRGLEDCYTLNPKSSKALVFAGWKDMDEYIAPTRWRARLRSWPKATAAAATRTRRLPSRPQAAIAADPF